MLKTQRLLGRCGAGNKGVQEAQRLLESAGRKATVNLRNGLWIRGGGEKTGSRSGTSWAGWAGFWLQDTHEQFNCWVFTTLQIHWNCCLHGNVSYSLVIMCYFKKKSVVFGLKILLSLYDNISRKGNELKLRGKWKTNIGALPEFYTLPSPEVPHSWRERKSIVFLVLGRAFSVVK